MIFLRVSRWRGLLFGGIALFMLPILFLAYAFSEAFWLEIKQVPVIDPNIPAAFDGVTIVFATDIHHGRNFPIRRLRAFVNTVNQLHPDIVLFGGDYYQWREKYIKPVFAELTKIHAPLGKFGVFGNHDYWKDFLETARPAREQAGIAALDNQAVWIVKDGARIKIGGVGDWEEARQDLRPTVRDVTEQDFVILLSHNPEFAEFIHTRKIDLVLSGHTHGGQVSLFGLWSPCARRLQYGQKYLKGSIRTPFTTVMVSKGVGSVFLPMRFFARPDILVLTLKKPEKPLDIPRCAVIGKEYESNR